jgi:hypothetical protein
MRNVGCLPLAIRLASAQARVYGTASPAEFLAAGAAQSRGQSRDALTECHRAQWEAWRAARVRRRGSALGCRAQCRRQEIGTRTEPGGVEQGRVSAEPPRRCDAVVGNDPGAGGRGGCGLGPAQDGASRHDGDELAGRRAGNVHVGRGFSFRQWADSVRRRWACIGAGTAHEIARYQDPHLWWRHPERGRLLQQHGQYLPSTRQVRGGAGNAHKITRNQDPLL